MSTSVGSKDKATAGLEVLRLKQAAAWGFAIVEETSSQLVASNRVASGACESTSADATGDSLPSLSHQQTSSSAFSLFIVNDAVDETAYVNDTALSGRLNSNPVMPNAAAFLHDMAMSKQNAPILAGGIGTESSIGIIFKKKK